MLAVKAEHIDSHPARSTQVTSHLPYGIGRCVHMPLAHSYGKTTFVTDGESSDLSAESCF